ncbi:isochorismatase family protein [Mycobacterium sp. 21AC1]|uniref:isochorismatase family protein n=1 Tax=[Mycobacterium] appelbergii TaxID=2939269 RepID=UPI002938DA70|nr:isochorismatase family protein [Mycobacterium sp. 21AC1]MDV3130161.1 isochorismatase family protein [Mycobacterium sp. 21AC1]
MTRRTHWGRDTDRVYDTAGFGSPARRGDRPAVVVVDLTCGFTQSDYPTGSDLTDVVIGTERLCTTARSAGIPVIYTVIAYTPAEADGASIAWLDKAPGMRAMRAGSDAATIDPRLTVTEADEIIVKKGASAYFGTHLAALLTSLHRDTVIVCGATTSGCVRATAVDAVQYGFGVMVVSDCVGDRAEGPHLANLFDIDAKYGDVVDLASAIEYLQSATAAANG